jgi:flagellar protein FliO/FliZ
VNSVELIGRMLLALGVVLGVMWVLARWARRPLTGKTDRVLAVLARQQLSRNASVAVVKVLDKALIVGVTESGVRLLSEADLESFETALSVDKPAPRVLRAPRALRADPDFDESDTPAAVSLDKVGAAAGVTRSSALDGSVLSPKVWKQLLNAARDVTVRR